MAHTNSTAPSLRQRMAMFEKPSVDPSGEKPSSQKAQSSTPVKKVVAPKVEPKVTVEPTPELTGHSPSKSPVQSGSIKKGTSAMGVRLAQMSAPSVKEVRLSTEEFHTQLRDPKSELAQSIHKLTHDKPKLGSQGAQLKVTITDCPTKPSGTCELPVEFSFAGSNIDIKANLPNQSFGKVSGAKKEAMAIHLASSQRGEHVHLEWVGAHPGEQLAVGGDQLFKAIESLYSAVQPKKISLADAAGFALVRGEPANSFPVQACVVGPYTKGASVYVAQGYLPPDSATKNVETFKAANLTLKNYKMSDAVRDLGGQAATGGSTTKTLNQLLEGFAEKGFTPGEAETVGAFYTRLTAATPATLSRETVHDFYKIAMERKVAVDNNVAVKGALSEVTTRTMLEKDWTPPSL